MVLGDRGDEERNFPTQLNALVGSRTRVNVNAIPMPGYLLRHPMSSHHVDLSSDTSLLEPDAKHNSTVCIITTATERQNIQDYIFKVR